MIHAAAEAQTKVHATAIAWIRANVHSSLCPSRELTGRVVSRRGAVTAAGNAAYACETAKHQARLAMEALVNRNCYRYIVVSGCRFTHYNWDYRRHYRRHH